MRRPAPAPRARDGAFRRQGGFTLLEILVALAVVAIALLAILKTSSLGLANVLAIRERTLAHWVAMNQAAELELARTRGGATAAGGEEELAGHSWHWRLARAATPDPAVERLTITVSAAADGSPLAVVTTFRSKPSASHD